MAVGGTGKDGRLRQGRGSWETGLEVSIIPGSVHMVSEKIKIKRKRS